MSCNSEILFTYTFTNKTPTIIGPATLTPTGLYGGKSYYTWYDAFLETTAIIRWDIGESAWIFGYMNPEFTEIAVLQIADTACPVDPEDSGNWLITGPVSFSDINSEFGALLEETTCFPKEDWINFLQCKYSSWLEEYSKKLSVGICVDQLHHKNIVISKLINLLYRIEGCNLEYSCLTEDEICKVIGTIQELTSNCNCK